MEQAIWQERPIEEDEGTGAIRLMKRDKAPGLDGFPILFYKVRWDIIKDDLMQVISDFLVKGFLDKGNNATFISLILKKEGRSSYLTSGQ